MMTARIGEHELFHSVCTIVRRIFNLRTSVQNLSVVAIHLIAEDVSDAASEQARARAGE